MMLPGSFKLNQQLLYSLVYPRTVRLQRRLNLNNSYYFLRSKARVSFLLLCYSEHTRFIVSSFTFHLAFT